MSNTVRVAGVQMNIVLGAADANVDRMIEQMQSAAGQGARIIVFPECSVSGYCFENLPESLTMSEPLDGPSTSRMSEACQQSGVWAVYGMLEREADHVYNSALLVGPDGLVAHYRKTHLPFLGVDRFTTAGQCPYEIHDAAGLRIGMNICYDASFPEASRALALAGADLIVLPTNWPPGSEMTAEHVINARALENNIYFMAVNRIGEERGFRFIGNSRVCAPSGHTIAQAPADKEIILYADIDPSVARNKHLVRVPKLHEIRRFEDRRPDLYGPLTGDTDDLA